jgi:hypothetical protein
MFQLEHLWKRPLFRTHLQVLYSLEIRGECRYIGSECGREDTTKWAVDKVRCHSGVWKF